MKMLFKQRLFSWFDSYDIFDENGGVLYSVKGQLSWGHKLNIYDGYGNYYGQVCERILTWLPAFDLYQGDRLIGTLRKEFTLFKPKYSIDFNGWHIEGDYLEWDYRIVDGTGNIVAVVSKEIWNWTDTYSIEVADPFNALYALMVVLAIDAEKCSRNN
ncbi:MAG: LURP-one-related family protein [Clostridia bacterium]|nr:LURP-one-related family protein [Clostridia bacterium]